MQVTGFGSRRRQRKKSEREEGKRRKGRRKKERNGVRKEDRAAKTKGEDSNTEWDLRRESLQM